MGPLPFSAMLPLALVSLGLPPFFSQGRAEQRLDISAQPTAVQPTTAQPTWRDASEETLKLFNDFVQKGVLVVENTSNVQDHEGKWVNPNQLFIERKATFREQAIAPEAMILDKERILNIQGLQSCPPSKRVAICAIMKNAAPILPQWLAWHRLLGVGSFHIFDDHSTDNTDAVVGPWIAAGMLTHEPAPDIGGGQSVQLVSYQRCMERFGSEHEWIGFIDADELLQPMREESECLPTFLSRPEFAQAGSVGLNWMFLGSGDDYILTNEPPERFGGNYPKDHPRDPTTLWDLNGFGYGSMTDQWNAFPLLHNRPRTQEGNAHVKSFCRPSRSQPHMSTPHFCQGAPQLSESAQRFDQSWHAPPTDVHMRVAHHESMSMQYWIEKRVRGSVQGGKPCLPFDLAHVFEEWKQLAIRSTGSHCPAPQNETQVPAWRATMKRLNTKLKECF